MAADRPLRPPGRLFAAVVFVLSVAGPLTIIGQRHLDERARLVAPTVDTSPLVTPHRLVPAAEAARAIRADRVRALGPEGSLTRRIPGAVAGLQLPETPAEMPWLLLCHDPPTCQEASRIGDRLVARGDEVMGLAPLPDAILDALDRPARRAGLAPVTRRARSRLLAPVRLGARAVGWVGAMALLPFLLHLLLLPAAGARHDRTTTDVLLDSIARLGRLGVLALVASAALASPELTGLRPSIPGALAAAGAVGGAGWVSARSAPGRWGAVAVAVLALPWLAGWPAPLHALVAGAALAEAVVNHLRGRGLPPTR